MGTSTPVKLIQVSLLLSLSFYVTIAEIQIQDIGLPSRYFGDVQRFKRDENGSPGGNFQSPPPGPKTRRGGGIDLAANQKLLLRQNAQGKPTRKKPSKGPEICQRLQCQSPPTDECTLAVKFDRDIIKPTHPNAGCCPLLKCYNPDGSFFSFHGLEGILQAPQSFGRQQMNNFGGPPNNGMGPFGNPNQPPFGANIGNMDFDEAAYERNMDNMNPLLGANMGNIIPPSFGGNNPPPYGGNPGHNIGPPILGNIGTDDFIPPPFVDHIGDSEVLKPMQLISPNLDYDAMLKDPDDDDSPFTITSPLDAAGRNYGGKKKAVHKEAKGSDDYIAFATDDDAVDLDQVHSEMYDADSEFQTLLNENIAAMDSLTKQADKNGKSSEESGKDEDTEEESEEESKSKGKGKGKTKSKSNTKKKSKNTKPKKKAGGLLGGLLGGFLG